jgi:hypothetical protein
VGRRKKRGLLERFFEREKKHLLSGFKRGKEKAA